MKTIEVNAEYCPQNHPCPTVRMCPVGAISQKDFFSVPVVDEEKCTGCGICTTTCGVFSLKH